MPRHKWWTVAAAAAVLVLVTEPTRAEAVDMPPQLQPMAGLLGKPAPEFSLDGADDAPVSLAALRDGNRVVVLQFWATWCVPCHFEALIYKQMLQVFPPEDLAVVGLHANDPSAAAIPDIRARLGMDYPVAISTDAVWTAYGDTPVLPMTVVIGRSGRVRRVALGVHWVDEVQPILRALTQETVEEARAAQVTIRDFDWGAPESAPDA